ncbi:MAG: hypothetical protein ACXWH7_15660, partial [Thermoanaerobaculia bacterium]
AGMLSSGSGAKASLQTFLGNVDHELMQSIVDEAHAKFVDTLTYTKFVDGFWAEGGTGKWVSADEANNRALAGLGIDIGPVSSKKAIVLEADRDAFREKTLDLLEGTSNAYRKGVLEIRK